MRYAIVIDKAGGNLSAYVPDLPGCVATGATLAEIEVAIREAIEFHLDGMREDGEPINLNPRQSWDETTSPAQPARTGWSRIDASGIGRSAAALRSHASH